MRRGLWVLMVFLYMGVVSCVCVCMCVDVCIRSIYQRQFKVKINILTILDIIFLSQ